MPADASPADFGSKLRQARERRGVSLREIANATKISVAALEALERNDISKLPGGIFSRAFVRSYAVEVGLDPERTVQEFVDAFPNDAVAVGHPTMDEIEDGQAIESRRRMARTIARLVAVSLPVAALILYLTTAGRRSATIVDLPAAAAAPPAAAPAVAGAPPATEPLKPAASPDPAASPTDRRTAPGSAVPSTGSGAPATVAEPPPAGDLLLVGLAVRTPCVVSATVDGKKAIDQVLRPGDKRSIEVRREIVLTVGDASAVMMTLNGADARALGKAGEVVTVRFNLTTFKDYLSAR